MQHKPFGIYEKYIKRPLDCCLAVCTFIVLLPALGIIALLVMVKLGVPVLFKQERPGKSEKIFKLYKFRTMTDEKDENGELLPDELRLTKFGRTLRSSSLDELPELMNIIKGDMALVGPRPLLIKYLPYYTEDERHRHDVRPGLTGWAQVNGRNNTPWEKRFMLDLEYVNHITFSTDIKIFFLTVVKLFKRSDIVVAGENDINDLDEERRKLENGRNRSIRND